MDPKYDSLDNLFRKQLSDATPDAEWNVPEDSIFHNAIAQVVVSRKKREKGIFWFLLATGFLMFLVVHEYTSAEKIKELKEYATSLERIIQTAEAQKGNEAILNAAHPYTRNEINTPSLGVYDIPPKAASVEQKKVFDVVSNDVNSHDNSNNGFDVQSKPTRKSMWSVAQAEDMTAADQQMNNESHSKVASTMQNLETPICERLPLLSNSLVAQERMVPVLNVMPNVSMLQTDQSNHNTWAFGLQYGANSSWLTMKNTTASMEAELTKYNNSQLSSGLHSLVWKKLSTRWSVAAGLGYNQYKNESELDNTIYYDEKNEIITSTGEHFYQADVEMSNPLGEHRSMTNVPLRQMMHQNDVILEHLFIRQTLAVASFEMGLDYSVYHHKNIELSIGSGLIYNVKIALENDFDINLSADGFDHHYQENVNKLGGFNSTFLAGYIRCMAEVKLDNHWSILSETRYGQSLGSLRDSWPSSGPQTYLHYLNVSLGIAYHF